MASRRTSDGRATAARCFRHAILPVAWGAILLAGVRTTELRAAEESDTPELATPKPVSARDPLPHGNPAIGYHETGGDLLATLDAKLAAGDAALGRRPVTGYLEALLDELDVPVESQLLVFSKTALNVRHVKPTTPRAVYFNDDVYVGWVPGARDLEISVDHPSKGGVFYTLSQDPEKPQRFVRQQRCLACHASSNTVGVPGHVARSFLVDDKGRPQSGYSRVTHDMPFERRFGGWYVTGTFGGATHLGNLRNPQDEQAREDDPRYRIDVADLSNVADLSDYPSTHSDAVAHLVLHHQLHGRNLITRVGYEARLGVRSDAEEQLLRYLFFVDEPAFPGPVTGTAKYREWFESVEGDEPTLRTLNLKTRLFENRLSYLVFSNSFQSLPANVRERLWKRIDAVLAGANPTPEFARISAEERKRIRTIVAARR